MPWRALILTETKSLMNLKAFCTLNRPHISKTHENSLDWNLITTARDHMSFQLKMLMCCQQKSNSYSIPTTAQETLQFRPVNMYNSTISTPKYLFIKKWVFEIWGRLRVQNAFKFIKLFISVNISARQDIGARLEAYKYPSKIMILLKIQYFINFHWIL